MRGRSLFFPILLILFLCVLPHAGADTPAPVYKAEFFSYEGPLRLASGTHSFARFSKMENGVVTEVVDISWMAAPGYLRRNNRMPLLRETPGQNYSLEETLSMAVGKNVASHGQYFITPDLFEAARKRKFDLEANRYSYKLIDGRSQNGINCIHAVSGVLGYLNTGLRRGAGASNSLVGYFLGSGHMSSTPFKVVAENGANAETAAREVPAEPTASPTLTPHASIPTAPVAQPSVAEPVVHGTTQVYVPSAQAPRQPLLSRFRRR